LVTEKSLPVAICFTALSNLQELLLCSLWHRTEHRSVTPAGSLQIPTKRFLSIYTNLSFTRVTAKYNPERSKSTCVSFIPSVSRHAVTQSVAKRKTNFV